MVTIRLCGAACYAFYSTHFTHAEALFNAIGMGARLALSLIGGSGASGIEAAGGGDAEEP